MNVLKERRDERDRGRLERIGVQGIIGRGTIKK